MTSLTEHTIERIEIRHLQRRYPRHIGWNAQTGPHGTSAQVGAFILHTDQGASGWGFSGAPAEMAQPFIGRRLCDLFDPETGTVTEARCIDIALHDLAAKILGEPVWRMLGARGGPSVPVYSGAIYFDDLNPEGEPPGVGALLDACLQDASAGYAHFKLKIGRGFKYMERAAGDARDVEVTRLVREHFPDALILVDGNCGYTPEGICRYLEKVADCNLYWIEEAFAETEQGLRMLRAAVDRLSPDTLIADGEGRHGRGQDPPGAFGKWEEEHLEELYALCSQGLLDVLLMDVGAMGFTAWRRVMPRLHALGVGGSPHAWSEPYKTYYAAQIGCGLGGVPIVEGVPGRVEGVDDSGYVLADGALAVPDSPGFGLDLCS
ncbi:MAG: mandelate racemase/muconate lactonizing enzyme family protein [Planctomycetota bacterium]|jgi:L-alanine-DL-glutamate epimerase-like enolase superfamily enzyme